MMKFNASAPAWLVAFGIGVFGLIVVVATVGGSAVDVNHGKEGTRLLIAK